MTETVDPGDVNSTAAQWLALRHEFDAPPPNISGNGPESAAARAAIAAAKAATDQLKGGVEQTAGTAQSGASAYQAQEAKSADTLMKPTDISSMMKDLIGDATSLFGTFPQSFGVLTGLAGSSAGVIGSLTGAVTSAEKAGGQQNSNNTNPEDSHNPLLLDPVDPDAHTTSAAPAAAHQSEPDIQTKGKAR
jgi:hypothetical protein